MNTTGEHPFFFGSEPGLLFGVYHEPLQDRAVRAATTLLPFVFCHALAEEKLWAHRVFVSFARELARRGHPVLRFDFTGNGDSSGEFSDWSLDTGLGEIGMAIDELKARTGASLVGLLGLRLGATLAGVAAEERDDVGALALWSPIVDGNRYVQDLLRVNLMTQMAVYREVRADREALARALEGGATVNIDGYEMSRPLYEQLSALRLADGPKRFAGPCLIAHITPSERIKAPAELHSLRQLYGAASLLSIQEDPFWKEIERFYDAAPNLFSVTLQWLEQLRG